MTTREQCTRRSTVLGRSVDLGHREAARPSTASCSGGRRSRSRPRVRRLLHLHPQQTSTSPAAWATWATTCRPTTPGRSTWPPTTSPRPWRRLRPPAPRSSPRPWRSADLGIQTVLIDPTGAHLGAWEARTFPGFTVLDEHGAPELVRAAHPRLRRGPRVLPIGVPLGDHRGGRRQRRVPVLDHAGPGRRRTAGRDHGCQRLPPRGISLRTGRCTGRSTTSIIAVTQLQSLGGSVVMAAEDTPYGRIATVADPGRRRVPAADGARVAPTRPI